MTKGHFTKTVLLVLTCLSVLPATARAQSAFTGVVKDSSGAVLPGVTVEAASPALIEKMRSVVTDENGAYRLVDLPSDLSWTMSSELKFGALEETLTVTGASPIVDVQSTTKSQVLTREVL